MSQKSKWSGYILQKVKEEKSIFKEQVVTIQQEMVKMREKRLNITLYMLDFHTWFNDRKEFLAFCNLGFMPSLAPTSLVTFDPRYVNYSTSIYFCGWSCVGKVFLLSLTHFHCRIRLVWPRCHSFHLSHFSPFSSKNRKYHFQPLR